MKAWLAVIVSLVAMGCLDVRASEPQTWSTTLTWKLSLDAGGQITGLSLAQNPDQIPHKSVAETIRKWKFSQGNWTEFQRRPTRGSERRSLGK